jgi:large subunit ribosomal protein L4
MAKVQVINQSGQKTRDIELPDRVFSYPVKEHLLYEAVINRRANQRRGTASTKTRGEVSGSNRKPWRQKGTGRARVGMIRNPIWRKGGIVFGPRPKDYHYEIPKKAKLNALRSALALKHSENRIMILAELVLAGPKTKEAVKILKDLSIRSALVVDGHENTNLFRAMRNIPKVKAVDQSQVNAYDVLDHEWLVMTERAYESLMERFQS